MQKLDFPYEVLASKCITCASLVYTLQVRKYRLKSYIELLTGCIVCVPLITDFSAMPDNYDKLCTRYEFKLRPKLSVVDNMKIVEYEFVQRYLQNKLVMPD